MKQISFSVFLLIILSGTFSLRATGKHPATGSKNKEKQYSVDFIQNKGQWNNQAKFKAELPGGSFFLTGNGFVYNFIEQNPNSNKDRDSLQNHYHAYKVDFAGSNKNTWFTKADERTYYHNYYIGNDPTHWATGVGIYGKVIQHNIYDGIDMVLYSEGTSLKYDFLVAPGYKAKQIKLSYEGVQPTLTLEGSLKITTTVNEIIEQKPYCYQVVNGKVKVVPSQYKIVDELVTFEFPEGYDESIPLVIDPTVVFSTYSGASYIPPPSFYAYSGLYQHATTYDHSGKLYSSVSINSLGWPVTMGAYQAAPSTKRDIGINVFNTDGTSLVYATYFGGASNEIALTMLTNEQNELFIAGSTGSDDLPMTIGCYDNTYNGSSATIDPTDIFVAHFNNTGTQLLGATYIGGNENELVPSSLLLDVVNNGDLYGINIISPIEIALDSADNIWLVSNTKSANFPVTVNAQQPAYAGGQTDIVLCKFNPNCTQLLYSSYLGSAGFDIGNSIVLNKNKQLVICGATSGNNFPVSTGALVTNAPGGTSDGFAAIVNPTNGSLMYSSYLGTNLADQACIVQVDNENNVYVAGRTYGNYPVFNSAFSMAGGDVFLQKLNPTLSTSVASTRLGISTTVGSRLIPTGFVLTECDEIIFSGFSHAGPSPLPTTMDAIDIVPKSFWFCSMPKDFSSLTHASFWGSIQNADSRRCGTSHYDPKGIIYQSLTSGTLATFPTTAGAWSTSTQINTGLVPKGDAVSFKIAFASLNADFVLDATVNDNDSGCAPYDIQVVNTSNGASSYVWDFGDGSALDTSVTPLLHTYATPGNYTITLYASNDTACVESDTAFMLITVVEPALLPSISTTDSIICSNLQTLEISVQINNPNPNFEVRWTPPMGIQGPATQPTITVNPALNDVYHVTVTDNRFGLCIQSATDSVSITFAPNMLQLFTQDTTVCQGQIVQVSATGNPQYTYAWSPSIGLSDSAILETVITVDQPQNYVLTASYPGCPDTVLYLDIDMHYYPTVTLGPDKSFCAGVNVPLESSVSPYRNDYIYSWTPATSNLSNPNGPNTHFIAETTIDYTLNVETPIGCLGSESILIVVFPTVNGGITPDTGFCPDGQLQLLATGGSSYIWTPSYGLSDTTIADPIAAPETSTEYMVVITNEQHCVDTQKVMVEVFSNAVLNMADSINVYPGEQYQLEPATNCLYFSWFPPSGISAIDISNPIFDPEVRTRYFVTATTEHGCSLKDSIDVLVRETIIEMPNAFMPTGANNLFKPSFRGIVTLKSFNIFNRWGNKVYASTDINSGWDGSFNGNMQPMGVYVYVVEAVTDTGRVFTKKGNVTLIR